MTAGQLKELRHIWVNLSWQRNVIANIDDGLSDEPTEDLATVRAGLDAAAGKLQRFIEHQEMVLRNKGAR